MRKNREIVIIRRFSALRFHEKNRLNPNYTICEKNRETLFTFAFWRVIWICIKIRENILFIAISREKFKIQNLENLWKNREILLTFVVLTENKGVSKGDDEDFLDELLSCTWKTSAKASVPREFLCNRKIVYLSSILGSRA